MQTLAFEDLAVESLRARPVVSRPTKILLVEDEPTLNRLYSLDLEFDGYSVISASDATQALRAFDHDAPDLVVTDIRLPDMDGLELVEQMVTKRLHVPIVINTAYACYKDNILAWGADAYVVKSSDTGELRRKIRELLDRPGARVAALPRPA